VIEEDISLAVDGVLQTDDEEGAATSQADGEDPELEEGEEEDEMEEAYDLPEETQAKRRGRGGRKAGK
jgi:hypothetical protein